MSRQRPRQLPIWALPPMTLVIVAAAVLFPLVLIWERMPEEMTIGSERLGLRILKGREGGNGQWHPYQPTVFVMFNQRRVLW